MGPTARPFITVVMATILVVWITLSDSALVKSSRARYEVQMDYLDIYNLSSDVYQNVEMRIKKFNRTTYVVNGSYELLDTMDDRFSAIVSIYSDSGNEYKLIMPPMNLSNLCESMMAEKQVYPSIVQHSNLPKPGDCPIPPNKYWIKEYPGDVDQFPEIPYHVKKLKLETIIRRDQDVVGVIAVYVIIQRV